MNTPLCLSFPGLLQGRDRIPETLAKVLRKPRARQGWG